MKPSVKNIARPRDDSLYGLLSSYKSNYTYVRVLVSDTENVVAVQLTDNPKYFNSLVSDRYRNYRTLRRLEIGITKMSLKYLVPENLIAVMGPLLEINIPPEKVVIVDSIKKDGMYTIETTKKFQAKIVHGVRKILNMSPQKRYEILEKYLAGNQE